MTTEQMQNSFTNEGTSSVSVLVALLWRFSTHFADAWPRYGCYAMAGAPGWPCLGGAAAQCAATPSSPQQPEPESLDSAR